VFVNCCWKIGEDLGAWPLREPEEKEDKLSMMTGRRLTPLGRMAFEILNKSSTALGQRDIPWIISCRHGDANRMVNLLTSLSKGELLSPTDFSMSVHNAIIGAYSILTKSKKMNTALSAAESSFETGLMEAFALQQEKKETVGYMYYDMPLPSPYEEKVENNFPETCLALLLKGEEEDKGGGLHLNYRSDPEQGVEKRVHDVMSFIGFLKSDKTRYEIPVPGGHFIWERHDQ
jgi:hypothetical protein